MKWLTALGITAFGTAAYAASSSGAAGVVDGLQPWRLTALRSGSPRHTPNTTLQASLFFTIEDTNRIRAGPGVRGTAMFLESTANCTAKWLMDEGPYHRSHNCTDIEAEDWNNWTFEVVETNTNSGSWPLTNFDLIITRTCNVTRGDNVYMKSYEGRAHFEVGATLGGLCSAGGICGFQLKNQSSPVLIEQSRTACLGEC